MRIEVLRMIGVASNGYTYEHYLMFTHLNADEERGVHDHDELEHLFWIERVTHVTAQTPPVTEEKYFDVCGNQLTQPPNHMLEPMHVAIEEFERIQKRIEIYA